MFAITILHLGDIKDTSRYIQQTIAYCHDLQDYINITIFRMTIINVKIFKTYFALLVIFMVIK